jgi:hypothetical protein
LKTQYNNNCIGKVLPEDIQKSYCDIMQNTYNVKPKVSWGNLPNSPGADGPYLSRDYWGNFDCNKKQIPISPAAATTRKTMSPSPATAVITRGPSATKR